MCFLQLLDIEMETTSELSGNEFNLPIILSVGLPQFFPMGG
jgi:hypothetical protein